LFDNIEWEISKNLIEYDFAISKMEKRVLEIKKKSAKELVWLLEHKSIYTAGTSAKKEDLKNDEVEVRFTGRGGQWTWHGPGQRVVYLMLNLKHRKQDVKAYVNALEELIIMTLRDFSIKGKRIENKPGVWVKNKNNNVEKIAAIGIRVKKWVAFHGFSLNLNVNKEDYSGIIPCGIQDKGIANISDFLDLKLTADINDVIISEFKKIFPDMS